MRDLLDLKSGENPLLCSVGDDPEELGLGHTSASKVRPIKALKRPTEPTKPRNADSSPTNFNTTDGHVTTNTRIETRANGGGDGRRNPT